MSRRRVILGGVALAFLGMHCHEREPLERKELARLSPATFTALTASRRAPALRELPRGGRKLFPAHRLVGLCGTPGAPALGRLTGDLDEASKAVLAKTSAYARASKRKVLPVFELIAVVVQGAPGDDGKWRRRLPSSAVEQYLEAARAARALLLLDIQPGRSDFLTEARQLERYLREPDVGLALDPEWDVGRGERPAEVFGQTSGAAIDDVAAYLSGLVKTGNLPEKALVYHQVTDSVVSGMRDLHAHPGVAIVQSVDGLGPKHAKVRTYDLLTRQRPRVAHAGIKLFFEEDTRDGGELMTPAEVLALKPVPEYVMYE